MSAAETIKPEHITEYRVVLRAGCTLVYGSLPISHFSALASAGEAGAVVSMDLKQLAGADFAWGPREACAALADTLRTQAVAAMPAATPLQRWLAVGERGMSSEAIVGHLRGLPTRDPKAHPHDPDDLRRCLALLHEVPDLVPDFPRMAEVSPVWAVLVAGWDKLTAELMAEAGPIWKGPEEGNHQGSAPRTYRLMRFLIEAAKA